MIRDYFEDKGISPVIGVILMVVVTVVMAAVIFNFVIGVGDNVDTSQGSDIAVNFEQQEDSVRATLNKAGTSGELRVNGTKVANFSAGDAGRTYQLTNLKEDSVVSVIRNDSGDAVQLYSPASEVGNPADAAKVKNKGGGGGDPYTFVVDTTSEWNNGMLKTQTEGVSSSLVLTSETYNTPQTTSRSLKGMESVIGIGGGDVVGTTSGGHGIIRQNSDGSIPWNRSSMALSTPYENVEYDSSGYVYAITEGSGCVKLDVSDGSTVWNNGDCSEGFAYDETNNVIYNIGGGSGIATVDPSTGNEQTDLGSYPESSESTPAAVAKYNNDYIYSTDPDGRAAMYHIPTNTFNWKIDLPDNSGGGSGTVDLAVGTNNVFVSTGQGIFKIDKSSGNYNVFEGSDDDLTGPDDLEFKNGNLYSSTQFASNVTNFTARSFDASTGDVNYKTTNIAYQIALSGNYLYGVYMNSNSGVTYNQQYDLGNKVNEKFTPKASISSAFEGKYTTKEFTTDKNFTTKNITVKADLNDQKALVIGAVTSDNGSISGSTLNEIISKNSDDFTKYTSEQSTYTYNLNNVESNRTAMIFGYQRRAFNTSASPERYDHSGTPNIDKATLYTNRSGS